MVGVILAVKLRAMWWAFAHTLVTSQFVLGIRDYPWDKTPSHRVEEAIRHSPMLEQKPAQVHFLLGGLVGAVGQKICQQFATQLQLVPKRFIGCF